MTGAGRVGRRLSRILLLLPYAIQHPGTTVGELSQRFDIPRNELINDLNLVFLCGLPGYGPGDLIDVDVQEDRIYIHMADYFAAPLRLTPAEGLALYAGGEAIAALPDMEGADSLRRALTKLGRALGADRGDAVEAAAVEVRFDPSPTEHMRTLQRALTDHKQVRIDYFSASSSELSTRNIDPWALIAALGRWYLVGLDHKTEAERMFRVDRIKRVELTEEEAPVPEDFDPERYKGAFAGREGQLSLTIEISPGAARWFEDYYPVESSRELNDHWREVKLVTGSTIWAATLVLRLGEHVRNIKPAAIVDRARELARQIAARHA